MARETRIDNFDASAQLTTYESQNERWSLTALDKQIASYWLEPLNLRRSEIIDMPLKQLLANSIGSFSVSSALEKILSPANR